MGSLHQCLREKRYHQFIYLVKLQSNLDDLDDRMHTPLISICSNIDNDQAGGRLMRVLVRNGADTDITDEEGLSPLHILCKRNKTELVRTLLKLFPDISVSGTDIYGNTPLHYAAAHNNIELISQLLPLVLRYRINADARNQLGFTPLLIAASNGRLAVARYLAKNLSLSRIVKDSLYFTSFEDWFKIYYVWADDEDILSEKTEVTLREGFRIQMEKDCLIPVATKPAANLLLETFSRENSAAQSRRSSAAAARESRYKSVPKIVISSSSSRGCLVRPKTAPNQRSTKPNKDMNNSGRVITTKKLQNRHRISLDMSKLHGKVVDNNSNRNSIGSGSREGSVGHSDNSSQKENEFPVMRRASTFHGEKTSGGQWGSLVELANICSEQLSDSFRKTIVPKWIPLFPEPEPDPQLLAASAKATKGGKDPNRAASILMGLLSKNRKQGGSVTDDSSASAEDDQTAQPANVKPSIRAKLLKMKRAPSTETGGEKKADDDTKQQEEPASKAASLLRRAVFDKKVLNKPTVDKQEVIANE